MQPQKQYVDSQKGDATTSQMGDTKWVDYHTKSPQSQDRHGAQLRPDVLFSLRFIADQTVLEEAEAEEGEGGTTAEGFEETAKARDTVVHILHSSGSCQLNGSFQLQSIWWLQIIAAVEMKPRDPKNWEKVVKQLIGYLRRILREQLDRRFVFGLNLGPDTMTVWMHDRSGVIGTKTAINIHKVGKISMLLVRMEY